LLGGNRHSYKILWEVKKLWLWDKRRVTQVLMFYLGIWAVKTRHSVQSISPCGTGAYKGLLQTEPRQGSIQKTWCNETFSTCISYKRPSSSQSTCGKVCGEGLESVRVLLETRDEKHCGTGCVNASSPLSFLKKQEFYFLFS